MKNCRVLLIFLLGFLSFNAQGTNYYVSTTGNDANAGTSLDAAYLTLAKAVASAIVAGDTIFVRPGIYVTSATVKINKPGTAAKPIVLSVYKPDMIDANSRPVFDFSIAFAVAGSAKRGIELSGANYWVIYGIIVKGAGDNGMNVNGSSHTRIEFCSFTRNRDSGLQIGGGSAHVDIINCDSYQNADRGAGTTSMGGNADGFAPKLDVGDSIYLKGCRAWGNSDDGYDGYMRPTGGVSWTLEDCWAFHNGYYWLDGSTTASQNGNGFKTAGSDGKNLAHNCTMIRCISFFNKSKGFDQNNNAGSMWLYNNTAYQNGGLDYGLNSPTGVGGVTYVPGAVTVVVNSTCTPGMGTAFKPGATLTNNDFTAAAADFQSLDTTGVSGQRNIDGSLPPVNFMRLSVASTLTDAGVKEPGISYHDSLGIPFYGTTLDIGAFEFYKSTVYTFIDNGNWSAQSKWLDHNMPPDSMYTGSSILIDAVSNGECLLDKPYTVAPGCTINVNANKSFRIPGLLKL